MQLVILCEEAVKNLFRAPAREGMALVTKMTRPLPTKLRIGTDRLTNTISVIAHLATYF